MKVFAIAAVSADGFLAPLSNTTGASTSWTSKEDTEFFVRKTKEAGVVVMGKNTYKTIGRPLKDRLNVVYSEEPLEGDAEVTQKEPKELLADLEKRGYGQVAILGGAQIFTMFLEAGFVDTVYLTLEPVFFGKGVNLFARELQIRLSLTSAKNLNENTLLLEYHVMK